MQKGALYIQMLMEFIQQIQKIVPKAKKIKKISYEEMLEMASLGAKVMQPHSIQDARLNRIDIEVRSSFKNISGSLITKRKNISKKI